jgi:hypothetical protein
MTCWSKSEPPQVGVMFSGGVLIDLAFIISWVGSERQ